MKKVLITGATGNTGTEVIHALSRINHELDLYAGVRNAEKDKQKFAGHNIKCIPFDFIDINTYKPALLNCDLLFLLRPPQLSDVKKYFKPLIDAAKECGIQHIVFLSVQGAQNSNIIPHHKIEKLIIESKISYTFLRPAYFMQNFTTTLRNDLLQKKRIFLPAGKAKFTIIDVRDVGEAAAIILSNHTKHINQAYDLTNHEQLCFQEMAEKISKGTGNYISYISPNLLRFFFTKRKEQTPVMMILVMIMLHYFPRFQKTPPVSNRTEKLTGKSSVTFDQFVQDYKEFLG